MMHLKLTFSAFLLFAPVGIAADREDQSENSLTAYNQQWQQCDHHLVRRGLIFKVVDVDWFTTDCQNNKNILMAKPVMLRFTYFREVNREFFIESATEYFLKNTDSNTKSNNNPSVLAFNQAYEDVEDGDIYDLVINDQDTLKLYKNNRLIQTTNHSPIRNNYFKIWFGQNPVLPDLKEAFFE